MDKKYKAISAIVTQEPGTEYDSETREKRYVIINTESGEIVDDAQGYGYKTAQKAYAGWSYKNRDKSKDKSFLPEIYLSGEDPRFYKAGDRSISCSSQWWVTIPH